MSNLSSALARPLGAVLDLLVAPAYCRLGYQVRAATWSADELAVRLSGRRYLVTGANSGIGRATVEALATRGATVYLACRDREKGQRAIDEIRAATGNPEVHLALLDVSVVSQVRRVAAQFAGTALHGLVHNAGVLLAEREQTCEGIERTFATNVLGPFLLTELLADSLSLGAKQSPSPADPSTSAEPARVVFVSSGGMYTQRLDLDDLQFGKTPFDGVAAYAQTKRAEILLSERFAKLLKPRNIVVNAMHPGWADTPGVAHSLPRFHKLLQGVLRDSAQGADTIVWLLIAAAAKSHRGEFFFDRLPRRTHLPFLQTESSPREVERLFAYCHELLAKT